MHDEWLAGETRFSLADEAATSALLAQEDFRAAVRIALRLLGCCFLYAPGEEASASALAALRNMDLADDWPFCEDEGASEAASKQALEAPLACAEALFACGSKEDETLLKTAFGALFRGPGHLAAPPWGSVYTDRDQVTYGRTWLCLRQWMRKHGIATAYEQRDPEDQFGRLMLLVSQLADERPDLLPELLGDHVLCWSSVYLQAFRTAAQKLGSPTYEACGLLASVTLESLRQLLGIRPSRRRIYWRDA